MYFTDMMSSIFISIIMLDVLSISFTSKVEVLLKPIMFIFVYIIIAVSC